MSGRQKELEAELGRIEKEIAELHERIPPHSVKPVFIQKLDELEARRDEILGELEMRNQPGEKPGQGE
ncbi:MAG: hypothetical protein KGY56_06860 [Desulfobacterales bacterium]|nr:hypothetical protein [Desulfobacterales bacterium]